MGLSASSSRGLLPTNLPLFSRLLQLPISLGMDLLLTPGEHVLRRDVTDGTVQADMVVLLHVALHQPLRPVIGDDPGPCLRVKFLGALQDDLDGRLRMATFSSG